MEKDVHNLGTFDTLDQVYEKYPNGGTKGDYVIVAGERIEWNEGKNKWGDFGDDVSSLGNQTVEGNLSVGHDLTVGGDLNADQGEFNTLRVGKIIGEVVYQDDIETCDSLSDFPQPGDENKLYFSKKENKLYSWKSESYISISTELGEIEGTAYPGDKGKKNSDDIADLRAEMDALPDIPTKVSDLTNDSGFITKVVSDLTNYYTKTQTYTREEINQKIAAIKTASFEVVDALPASGEENIIYLVPKDGEEPDTHDEYIWVDSAWELIGSTQIDLSNYLQKTGDASDTTVTFVSETGEPTSGSSLSSIVGRIVKKISDIVSGAIAVGKSTQAGNVNGISFKPGTVKSGMPAVVPGRLDAAAGVLDYYSPANFKVSAATNDSEGNDISSTYLKLSGGMMTGTLVQKKGDGYLHTDVDSFKIPTNHTGWIALCFGQATRTYLGEIDLLAYTQGAVSVDFTGTVSPSAGAAVWYYGRYGLRGSISSTPPEVVFARKDATGDCYLLLGGDGFAWSSYSFAILSKVVSAGLGATGNDLNITFSALSGDFASLGMTRMTLSAPKGPSEGIEVERARQADSATRATQDGDGNNISSTYLKRSGGQMEGMLSLRMYSGTDPGGELSFFGNNEKDSNGALLYGITSFGSSAPVSIRGTWIQSYLGLHFVGKGKTLTINGDGVAAEKFIGNLQGNATNDGDGNEIADTYLKRIGGVMTGTLVQKKSNCSIHTDVASYRMPDNHTGWVRIDFGLMNAELLGVIDMIVYGKGGISIDFSGYTYVSSSNPTANNWYGPKYGIRGSVDAPMPKVLFAKDNTTGRRYIMIGGDGFAWGPSGFISLSKIVLGSLGNTTGDLDVSIEAVSGNYADLGLTNASVSNPSVSIEVERARQDGNGNDISSTYATKEELPDVYVDTVPSNPKDGDIMITTTD